jgi:hypothetical protein
VRKVALGSRLRVSMTRVGDVRRKPCCRLAELTSRDLGRNDGLHAGEPRTRQHLGFCRSL